MSASTIFALSSGRLPAAIAVVRVSGPQAGAALTALSGKLPEPRKAALVWKPQNTVAIDDEQGEKVLKLVDMLHEHDDVQNVYANFEVSDALVSKMSA